MITETQNLPIGQQVSLPGHFDVRVTLEAARPLAKGFECRVRMPDGTLEEAVISAEEAAALSGAAPPADTAPPLANADQLRLLVESARIRLAYAHDRHFAVSLSGIRTLPHQIEALYIKMLPQPRLRFLLADDPGAGKTIMAGLLIKEPKLREAVERILILCPSTITDLLSELDPELNRQCELAAEDLVIAYENARGWECTRVGHEKIGFDIRSMGPSDPQTGYRDPVTSIRRIEVKGRKRGATIRLTTNEWYHAVQLGDSYWLYVVWDPQGKVRRHCAAR